MYQLDETCHLLTLQNYIFISYRIITYVSFLFFFRHTWKNDEKTKDI